MDWSTRLFGLHKDFLYEGGGGGIITVSVRFHPSFVSKRALTSQLPQGSASESALTAAIGARERALRILAAQDKKQREQESSLVPHDSQGTPETSIPLHSREKWSQRLVMYGSTQTHSIGSKVSLRIFFSSLHCAGASRSSPPVTSTDFFSFVASLVSLFRPL